MTPTDENRRIDRWPADPPPPPVATVAIDATPLSDVEAEAETPPSAAPVIESESAEPEPDSTPVNHIPEPEEPADPGASKLVNRIAAALADGDESSDLAPRIALGGWTNRSRLARQDEFQSLRRRAVDLLQIAGADHGLRFEALESEITTHRLEATAYLLSNGDETWELYVRLIRQDDRQLLWEPAHPVRMPRFPSDEEDQIVISD
jgi:hypothetical protein